jgi:HK97 family phage major capsid protein
MTIHITDMQGLAVRKLALPALRKLGVTEIGDYQPHTREWKDLQDHRKELLKSARAVNDGISDKTGDEELRTIEDAHNALVAVLDAIDRELDIRTHAGNRAPRPSGSHPKTPSAGYDGMEVSGVDESEGYTSRAGWSDRGGTEIRVLKPTERFSPNEYRGPSLGAILRAMVTGPRNDMERRVLAEGSDSAGGYTVPTPLAMQFIDRLRAASVVMRAGALTVDMTSETLALARLATDPTVAWRAENAEVTASDPTFARVLLTAKSLASLVKVSRELLEDSVNVTAMLERAFTQSMAVEFDRAALFGTGDSDDPEGVTNMTGIGSVEMAENGAALSGWDKVSDTIYELEVDNAGSPTAMIFHPRTGNTIRKLKDGEGNPLTMPTDIAAIPRLPTTSVPIDETQGTAENASSIVMGHFPELLIGLRSQLRIEILKERYGEYLQYGFLCHMRGDVQAAHVESFAVLKGITPS